MPVRPAPVVAVFKRHSVHVEALTLWCPLLPYGYSYKESGARLD